MSMFLGIYIYIWYMGLAGVSRCPGVTAFGVETDKHEDRRNFKLTEEGKSNRAVGLANTTLWNVIKKERNYHKTEQHTSNISAKYRAADDTL